MSSINSVIEGINNALNNEVGFPLTTFGLCDQAEKDGMTFPVENVGNNQGRLVEWNDKNHMRVYHRITGEVAKDVNSSGGFGKRMSEVRITPMRAVFIGTRDFLTTANYEDNQEIEKDVEDVFPRFVDNSIVQFVASEVRKPVVYEEEYSGVTKLQSLFLNGVAFWIDYEIRQRICG